MDAIVQFFHVLPFSSTTWIVLFVLLFMVYVIRRASKDEKSPLDWQDLFVDTNTNKLSPYRVGFFVGMIISTWTVMTLVDQHQLGVDIFGIYLTYLLGGASWNSWVKSKGSSDKE